MKTAIIYSRVSGSAQEKDGSSLDTQKEACLAFAQSKGFGISEGDIILETYSGLTLNRPQLSVLRERVKNEDISAIIVHTPDRLARVGEDILSLVKEFKIAGVKLQFVKEQWDDTLNGKLVAFMLGWASEFEASQIKERSTRGRIARAKEGRLPGGKNTKLYGYSYLAGRGVGEGIRIVDEQEARWVKEIYHWYAEDGLSLYAIILRLMSIGIKSPTGNVHWCTGTLHRILRNRAYIGETFAFTQAQGIAKPQEEWIKVAGATPPLISEDLFNKAQERLQKNKELSLRNAKREYLLRGYVFCRLCGRRYQGSFSTYPTKSGTREHRYYLCPSSRRINPLRCRNSRRAVEYLEGVVWQEIEAVLSKPDIVLAGLKAIEDEASKVNVHIVELGTIEARLKHMEREKDRVWKAFELTGDEPKFTVEIKVIMAQIAGLVGRREELIKRIELAKQAEVSIEGIKQACDIVSSNLAELSFESKRLALEALNIKVWLDKEDITLEGTIPVSQCIASTPS